MTLQEFTRDIVPIISALVAATGLFFVWFQLRSANTGISETAKWNRIHATYNFFDLERSIDLEIKARENIRKNDIEIDDDSISTKAIKIIVGNYELETPLNRFLNDIEMYACAYFADAIDKEISYHMHGSRIVAKYRKYEEYIEHYRKIKSQPDTLIEFEKLAMIWESELNQERENLRFNEVFHGKSKRNSYGIKANANGRSKV